MEFNTEVGLFELWQAVREAMGDKVPAGSELKLFMGAGTAAKEIQSPEKLRQSCNLGDEGTSRQVVRAVTFNHREEKRERQVSQRGAVLR